MRRYVTAEALEALAARLSTRDRAVLRSVSELRFTSGDQLKRLHFAGVGDQEASARATRRALLRLTRLDCLARLPRSVGGVRAGSAGFVYCLGPLGQRLVMEWGWQPKRRWRRSDVPGTLFLNHALQVAELHTLLIEADRSESLELLELTAEPGCHRTYGDNGGQRLSLKPDSFVRLGVGTYEDSYFIEVDMGSEGSRALSDKLRDYLAYAASGQEQAARGVFPRCLWLTPDTSRAAVIAGCVARLPRAAWELFQVAPFSQAVAVMASPEAGQGLPSHEKILSNT